MAAPCGQVSFSPNGEYLAYLSPDGCLKIWDTSSNCLKQEYTPSSHLSCTCTTLAWCSTTKQCVSPEKKTKKSRLNNKVTPESVNMNLIAMGTLSGEILLYNVTVGDLYTQMHGGHNDVVNDICSHPESDSIFSCSRDHHVVQWSITKGKVKDKWRADKRTVHSVCVVDESNLLTSSTTIKWWDLKNKTVLKEFIGHATEVFRLFSVDLYGQNSLIEGRYFLSLAVSDRVINAWQLKLDEDCNAVASFAVPDEPLSLSVIKDATKEGPLLVPVITKCGSMHIFEHQLNGKRKKPLEPKIDIHVISSNSENKKPVPFLAARIISNNEYCQVAYGNFLKPTFENIEITDLKRDTYLMRHISLPCAVSLEEGMSKVKVPNKSNNVKHIASCYMTPIQLTENNPVKRKRPLKTVELSMEERLNTLYPNNTVAEINGRTSVTSDSIVHLILQGLQTQDPKLLSTVFNCGNKELITNSVKQMPVHSIFSFLQTLGERMHNRTFRILPCIYWYNAVLNTHKSFLIGCKDASKILKPASQHLEGKMENYLGLVRAAKVVESISIHRNTYKVENREFVPEVEAVATYKDGLSSDEEVDQSEIDENDEYIENFEDIGSLNSESEGSDDDDDDDISVSSDSMD